MKAVVRKTARVQHGPAPRGNERRLITQHPRRRVLRLAAGAAALPAVSRTAWAQTYPRRPVRILVGFAAGGSTDIGARLIGQWLQERLGQPFIVENRVGAATNIATEAVVRAPADGYTLLAVTSANTISPALYKLKFNFTRDIAMVAGINRGVTVLEVHPTVPVNTFPEFIAYAKANPAKINLALAGGTGSIYQLAGALLKMDTGVQMVDVPYNGSGPMLIDLLAGRVEAAFDNLPTAIEHIRAGKLRPLAVATPTRSDALPGVPTISEFLPGFEANGWAAIGAPKNTPVEIIDKLNKEINTALAHPRIKARLAELVVPPFVGAPADLDRFVAEETQKWAKVIRAANIKAE